MSHHREGHFKNQTLGLGKENGMAKNRISRGPFLNSPARMYDNRAVTRECFRKPGRWVVSCHAKDVDWEVELQVHFKEVIPGRGKIDYGAYLTELSRLPVDAPRMLEHLNSAEEFSEGRRYIQGVAEKLGLSFDA